MVSESKHSGDGRRHERWEKDTRVSFCGTEEFGDVDVLEMMNNVLYWCTSSYEQV
jgi:hypothetical protein